MQFFIEENDESSITTLLYFLATFDENLRKNFENWEKTKGSQKFKSQ